MNKTPIICARCGREFNGGGWDEITTHACVKPIRTNADRIRAMSDEELAGLIWLELPVHVLQQDRSLGHIKDWLKQEVE